MKKVLCFGDSNTYGFIPETGGRYDKNTRWTGILQNLSKKYLQITAAGANNRTGFTISAGGDFLTGHKILPELLNDDFDVVIIAIGVNDLQKFYDNTEVDIKAGIEKLIGIVRKKLPYAKIIIAAPAVITENVLKSYFSTFFDKKSIEKSFLIAPVYKQAAEANGCIFVDLNDVAKVSEIDGLHYSAGSHRRIACVFFGLLRRTLDF